jgi:hypothetical protein
MKTKTLWEKGKRSCGKEETAKQKKHEKEEPRS